MFRSCLLDGSETTGNCLAARLGLRTVGNQHAGQSRILIHTSRCIALPVYVTNNAHRQSCMWFNNSQHPNTLCPIHVFVCIWMMLLSLPLLGHAIESENFSTRRTHSRKQAKLHGAHTEFIVYTCILERQCTFIQKFAIASRPSPLQAHTGKHVESYASIWI